MEVEVLQKKREKYRKKKIDRWRICFFCEFNSASRCPIWHRKEVYKRYHKKNGPFDLPEKFKCDRIKEEENFLTIQKEKELRERGNREKNSIKNGPTERSFIQNTLEPFLKANESYRKFE